MNQQKTEQLSWCWVLGIWCGVWVSGIPGSLFQYPPSPHRTLFCTMACGKIIAGVTLHQFHTVFVWSMNCLAEGQFPAKDHPNRKFGPNYVPERAAKAGDPLAGKYMGAWSEFRCDLIVSCKPSVSTTRCKPFVSPSPKPLLQTMIICLGNIVREISPGGPSCLQNDPRWSLGSPGSPQHKLKNHFKSENEKRCIMTQATDRCPKSSCTSENANEIIKVIGNTSQRHCYVLPCGLQTSASKTIYIYIYIYTYIYIYIYVFIVSCTFYSI